MCKLRCADINVKRKEKREGEEKKNDGRVLRQYKKTKSSRRLIVKDAIEKHIFAFVLIHQPKQADDTEDYRLLEIGMQF